MIDPELQKQLRERFNPEDSDLRRMQLRMLDMLKYIDRICQENDIKYWLSSGTCLGAVRHGGFIPWDDDCDIELEKKDFQKLRKILKSKNSKFILQEHSTDNEYVAPYAKLRDPSSYLKETNNNDIQYKYNGIYVDIFCIEPSSSLIISKISSYIQSYFVYPMSRIKNSFVRENCKKFIVPIIHNALFPILSMLGRVNNRDWYRHIPGSGFLKRRYKKDFEKIKYSKFEDVCLPIPQNAENYLTRIYGDFEKIPPISSIAPHIIKVCFLAKSDKQTVY